MLLLNSSGGSHSKQKLEKIYKTTFMGQEVFLDVN